jgi:hypothetical protein
MNVMTPTGGVGLTEILIHAGYVLTAAAFLLRDILWLRLLAIAANVCVGLAAYRAGMDPHWVVVAWAVLFVAINLGHSCWLIYERYLQRLTDEEQSLYDCCFQALDRVSVRKLLRHGEWIDFAAKDCLARQGIHLDRLLLLSTGEAAVLLGGKIVARLKTGKFVGEISFLSGDISTAMVVATEPVRCLAWKKEPLERLLARQPDLVNVFYAAVGKDLAAKVAHHNVALSQV